MRRSLLLIPVVVAVLAATPGCAPGGDDSSPAPSASTGSTRSVPGSETTSPSDLPDIPELKDSAGIAAAVALDSCATEAPLKAAGTVTNQAKDAKDLVIVINWATARGDVLARAVETLEDVPAGDTKDWEVNVKEKPIEAVQCSLSATAGTLG